MNRLFAELQRLYFLPDLPSHRQVGHGCSTTEPAADGAMPEMLARSLAGDAATAFDLVGADGRVRAMAVDFARAADWEQAAELYREVQEDLDLPPPAVSVSGSGGYRLWFSLAEPVPREQARGFLHALRRRYLADLPPARVELCPGGGELASAAPGRLSLVPARQETSGKWSAFIDPALGSMFVEEPWLEMAPNPDRQADLLAGFASIPASDFERALTILQPDAEAAAGPTEPSAGGPGEVAGRPGTPSGRRRSRLDVGSHFSDPQSFLLAVMNDPAASAKQRIKAAKALLPYFGKGHA